MKWQGSRKVELNFPHYEYCQWKKDPKHPPTPTSVREQSPPRTPSNKEDHSAATLPTIYAVSTIRAGKSGNGWGEREEALDYDSSSI